MTNPSGPAQTYEPELTGLLIVDPYNDVLSEGGKLYELCYDQRDRREAVRLSGGKIAVRDGSTGSEKPAPSKPTNCTARESVQSALRLNCG
ncbi:hypothetical protein [Paraburkholderia bannensis]|uniref:hypothetical protein n=1 Tax=Paraburkholderia bannensis TaxID=765414 RepID=UPI00048799F0|nr:hypothetical protein [Paraburkholderia bannensis]